MSAFPRDGVLVSVRVIPRARKSEIAGTRDHALLVRLTAPPVDGAANSELIELLATTFGVPKRDIAIVSGEHSREKRVRIEGRTAADVERLAGPAALATSGSKRTGG